MNAWIHDARQRAEAGENLALCTLVKTTGSTPQKAGAVMVVSQAGDTLGTIGGGCVEAEVRSRALRALLESRPTARVMRFKLDQDYGWDDGLVCGGHMDVAIEPMQPATLLAICTAVLADLDQGHTHQRTITAMDESGESQTYEHATQPNPRVVIAGGGHVGAALATIMQGSDWRICIVDDRPDFASTKRFPQADCHCGDIAETLQAMTLNDNDHVVIVTRGHKHDGSALQAVIDKTPAYIGLIGSRRKIIAIYRRLLDEGTATEAQLRHVHAPIGLRIGAVSPMEIAVSIAAELIATHRNANIPAARRMKLDDSLLDIALRPAQRP